MPPKSKDSRWLYLLLGLYIVVSLGYFASNIASYIDAYFDLHHRPNAPFQFNVDSLKITSLTPSAHNAGLKTGDTLVALNGKPYAGEAAWLTLIRSTLHPGDNLQVAVRQPNSSLKTVNFKLAGRSSTDHPRFREYGLVLSLYGIPPLICLLIGYWVVAARPRDFNAWLILVMLTFTETLFTINAHWWPWAWDYWSLEWMQIQQLLSPIALLLFGIYFPERWRLDRSAPWLKYVVSVPILAGILISLAVGYAEEFRPAWGGPLALPNLWMQRVVFVLVIACVAIYCCALIDKSRSASTADARRRLQVLLAGTIVGLGSLYLFFLLLPRLGVNTPVGGWATLAGTVLFLVFPFTLAYVVVVQRAMDVRILLRLGTKYALARATLSVIQAGLLIGLVVLLMHVLRAPSLSVKGTVGVIVLAGLLLLLRSRLTRNLSSWLDRKFFREAYNAEQLLAELSQRVRRYNDSGPMLEMVTKNLAQTLHIDKIAVLLRAGTAFYLQQAVGLDLDGFDGHPVQLPLNSTTVRNLMRINTPVKLYRENPDGWLLLASEPERRLLETMSAELLLPLPGREQMMGVITLGPKRSEEPYTSTDLQLLESVAAQTGLVLEIGNLARSLASAATQRERIEREIEVAREVQERLFPQEFPVIQGITLAGHCRPAQGVGGDYYDIFSMGDGRIGFAIGDVSGKGISAALLMASLRASLRGMALDAPQNLAAMMEKVNRLVYESSASNRYATFFFATFHPASGELVYVNAGHNAPFLIRGTGEDFHVDRLQAGGPVVGLLSHATYEAQRLNLAPGDLLLAYTDGISEAMTTDDEEWGEERMLSAALTLPDGTAQRVLDHLFGSADRFTGKAPQYDDMTLLVLKLEHVKKTAAIGDEPVLTVSS